jgi:hypothetical protein
MGGVARGVERIPHRLRERLAARRAVIEVLPALHREILGPAVGTVCEGHVGSSGDPTPEFEGSDLRS